ncbi:MAG: metalloregulator ArsR/SmtB family transcription factor [Acidimicrobiales bacterium]
MPNEAQPGDHRDLQAAIGALNSPIRREILSLIWDREVPAGEIAAAFDVTKPTISQHLAVLRRAGLVVSTSVGTSRRYRAVPGALRGLNAALSDPGRWTAADDLPERQLSSANSKVAVVVSVDVETDQVRAFNAFVDPALYSRWLGVPVTIQDGRFACTMEWGTNIRGRYEVVSPPELIAMRWDFEDNTIPLPLGELVAYLRVTPTSAGAHVEVHQLVDDAGQAQFMEVAWSMVLGRFKAGVAAAIDAAQARSPRGHRPKRRNA